MELLQTLGIDVKLLLAQIVNFAILLFVLWKVAYKPLLTLMKERSQRIEKSLDDAEALKRERDAWTQEHERLIAATKQETRTMVNDAKEQTEKLRDEMKKKMGEEMAAARAKSVQELKLQEQQTLKMLEQRVTALVGSVAQQFLAEKMTAKDDERLIKSLLASSRKA